MKFRRYIVTSALPYVNNIPHLGNLVCVISADVYQRFLRMKGLDVVSVVGTDEHGTTTEFKARQENSTAKEICEKYSKVHKEIYDFFQCDFTCFGRSSDKETHEITKEIFLGLWNNGYISEGELEQFRCSKCETFLADRFVIGTCPSCGYEKARGDQCENCGKLLNPTELESPECAFCSSEPEVVSSRHLFLELGKIQPKLEKFVAERKDDWTENAVTMTESWLKSGLKKRCITRDLKWGIKVPLKGYENKVFYSWFDAPIGYIGITKGCDKRWEEFWKDDKETCLIQFMGKDNIPFHTILFPAYLLGSGDTYTLMRKISVNEYLNYENSKFSKSDGAGVFGDDAKNIGIRADAWRYYTIINRPEKTDTFFSWDDFQSKLNNELVANLGNLLNRTFSFISRFYESRVPDGKADEEFFSKAKAGYANVEKLLDRIEIKEALKEIMRISRLGNQFFQEQEPWKNVKENKKKADDAMLTLANFALDLSILARPFMPGVSDDILSMLGMKEQEWGKLGKGLVKPGQKTGEPKMLFSKLEDKEKEELRARFSGRQENKEGEKSEDGFSILSLKVGVIKEAVPHPNADKLMVMKVDLGGEERQVIAGLKGIYSLDELAGRKAVFVANLKPAMLRGKESQGMVLACEDKQGRIRLLEPGRAKPGEQVLVDDSKPGDKEVSIDEFARVKLYVESYTAKWNGKELKAGELKINCELKEGKVT
ncbi:MAG TPA: methionine--tRNA ligase [Candidatus Woesearchaeota archaeon]|nr:methionine--tRNA ligase [Candidatus Woesearchaeota archaeon]